MYFKSLELIGFKSFAEKTKLNFEPGVTAIVGPNGTGKSNVADAIRWVLGEQSTKSLRASKMEDVIFNGTDSKEPINFAEVSLTLSNEKRILPIDYDEVIISRRVFRSGEAEYLLNKTPVRLKDISELLMGTGIGTESYSIIEQGKMDLILSSRPEDRRYVFEEASGITKYKSKKKEALRKLEQTEQNLLRINDIIQEVKRQIGSIERQARKAEKYKVDFDKLKELEIKLSSLEFKDLKTQEKTLFVESQDLKEREKDLSFEITDISAKISDYRQSLDELNQKVSDLKNKFTTMSGSLDMNIHKIEIDKERIAEAEASQKALDEEIRSIEGKISSAGALVDKLKEELKRVASERVSKQKAIEEKEFQLNSISKEIGETEEKLKTSKLNTVDYLAKETRIKNELIKMGADIQNRKARQRRLGIEKETVEKELNTAEETREAIRKEYESAEKNMSLVRADLEEKKGLEGSAASALKALEEDIIKEDNRKAAVNSKIEFLEDLVKRHEGFKAGVKNLLMKFGGILAVLADMIRVEKGYEEAVSTFLGDDAQIVVTEKDNDIERAIEHLKENKLGKATFISLETVSRLRNPSAKKAPANLTPLRNFVKSDSKYKILIDYLFDDAYLAESLDDGLKDYAAQSAVTLVTRTGLLFEKGRIAGGSSSETDESFLIGRRDRLESFKSESKELEERLRSLDSSRNEKAHEICLMRDAIKALEENLHAEDINLANVNMKKDSQDASCGKFKEELSVIGLELGEVNEVIDDLTVKGDALNKELNDIESESSRLQLFIEESQVVVSDKRTLKEKLILEITTLRAESQSLDKEEENARNNLNKDQENLTELNTALDTKKGLLEESAGKEASLKEEISSLALENETISKDLKLLSAESSSLEKARSDAVDKLSIDEIQLKDKEASLERLRNRVRDSDVKMTELNYKKTNLKDRIQQAYKVDLEVVHADIEENLDLDALKREVIELKNRLDKLGPVNLVAIDEHKELEERHAFLVHQQEDLVNAKESLHKAIQKINKTTKELFIDTFQKIQVEFKNFFRLLFGGGQAELILIDEQDVLESGIEIIVRPPGKKLQNIMLLSGGEKALTAIALLFSIFKVKPSPFCVLDEIDASLDDSNVTRFSNVLKDFLRISQFIIITHNKRTIELADVMYGITMQERGVSKIVSVKFMDERKSQASQTDAVEVPA